MSFAVSLPTECVSKDVKASVLRYTFCKTSLPVGTTMLCHIGCRIQANTDLRAEVYAVGSLQTKGLGNSGLA